MPNYDNRPFTPTLIYDDLTASWKCKFPYSVEMLEKLKRYIPHPERQWKKEEKSWIIGDEFIDVVEKLCIEYFGGAKRHKPTPPPAMVVKSDDSTCLEFLKLCPVEDVKKLYRAAVLANHSDKGGDDKKLAEITSRWTIIKKELGIA